MVIWYAIANRYHMLFKTGNRQHEFDKLYSIDSDPWDYRGSLYEREKYARTMDAVESMGGSAGCVLEVGASVGEFTKLLAQRYKSVVAIDISQVVVTQVAGAGPPANVEYQVAGIESFSWGQTFDIMFCCEVLYYIGSDKVDIVVDQIRKLVADKGFLVLVTGLGDGDDGIYFDGWDKIFSEVFTEVFRVKYAKSERPYKIVIYMVSSLQG